MFLLIVAIFGLCIGSFLNVVIYRLPKILFQSWRQQAMEVLNISGGSSQFSFNLATPRSFCPYCKHRIPLWVNIPLLGYFIAKRRCHYCNHRISWRYPFVEFITAVLSVLATYRWGLSWPLLPNLLFIWAGIVLFFIDIDYQLLPDNITLPLLWLGLIVNLFHNFITIEYAVIGAVLGYLVLWLVGWLFRLLRKTEGIGYGDFKLLAVMGAWFGPWMLVFIVLISSLLGSLVGLMLLTTQRVKRHTPIAFGPFLIIAGFIVLFYGQEIREAYLRWFFS